jgi:hypothetical protein
MNALRAERDALAAALRALMQEAVEDGERDDDDRARFDAAFKQARAALAKVR